MQLHGPRATEALVLEDERRIRRDPCLAVTLRQDQGERGCPGGDLVDHAFDLILYIRVQCVPDIAEVDTVIGFVVRVLPRAAHVLARIAL